MRVVYLSASGQLGGAERCLVDILASIRQAEPQWTLHLIAGADGPLMSRASSLGVASSVLPFPLAVARVGEAATDGRRGLIGLGRTLLAGVAATGYIGRLKQRLRSLGPDVMHSNGLKMHVLAVQAAPRGVPVLWHLHDYVGRRALARRLLRLRVGRCGAIVANSYGVAADARVVFGAASSVGVVPNGIDLAVFSPEGPRTDLDALAGLPAAPPGVVRVGLVATMARWKGHEVFLRALSLLPRDMPARAYVVGGPIYQTEGSQWTIDELRRRAGELGLGDRVGFTGFVDDPASVMRALDIVVQCSTEPEPFGLVVAEAMACARAVIATSALGAGEVAVPERDLLAFEAGDAAALARSISRVVRDAELRARLGRQARDTATKAFDRRRFATELVPIYQRMTSGVR
jgi:glycosyltransferase involved in cell wall biosynthesis